MHIADATMFWSNRGGGVQTYLRAKQRWFRARPGWEHSIVAPACEGPGCVPMRGLCPPVGYGYRLPIGRGPTAALLESLSPDIVEAGDPYHIAWATLDAARALDIPAVAFCHSNLVEIAARFGGDWTRGATRRYVRHLYSRFASVLAPSNTMAQALRDAGVHNVRIQPLGVDTTTFAPERRDAQWRESVGLAPDARALLYVGRYAPEKNLETLTQAVDLLGAPYVLVTMGSGPSIPRGARVLRLPFEPDKMQLAKALASADAVVHAGDQETFGLVALEALACGTPVVARAAAGLGEVVDETVGAAVPHAGAKQFAEAIEAVVSAGRGAYTTAARARARAYDWNCVMPPLAAHYAELIAAHAPKRAHRHAESVDLYRSA